MKTPRLFPTTFHWPDPRNVSLAPLIFFCVAVGIHVSTFALFRVVYPEPTRDLPPPRRLTLLAPHSPADRSLLDAIRARDPAATARPIDPLPHGHLAARYSPSYAESRRAPLLPEPRPASPSFPPTSFPALPAARSTPLPSPHPATPTRVIWDDALAHRLPAFSIPQLARDANPADPARFLLALQADGTVLHVFADLTSGDPALDAAAAAWLGSLRFKPDATPITWGFATFRWGADAFTPSRPTP